MGTVTFAYQALNGKSFDAGHSGAANKLLANTSGFGWKPRRRRITMETFKFPV